ncbi:ankyrin repeat domain-containing protein [Flavobacterium procerum]|uniref:Ankyrin repeat domain-containing protein n=1 Tax=Flavobacterium procerum TaxID=1455569 RepID=A0ABV6BNY3_9FLAO
MKALFTAIRERDTEKITELITKKPDLVNCIAKQPPKKDDGQSPLQIAFKTNNFWAVKYFLENGADVNFIDAISVNEWKMPVLHDAIMAIVALARFEFSVDPWDEEKKHLYELKGVKEHFDKAFFLLKIMVDKGADVNSIDSYGNSALMRVCTDIKNPWTNNERPLAKETIEDLKQIFDLLISSGADIYRPTSTRKAITETNIKLLEQIGIKI